MSRLLPEPGRPVPAVALRGGAEPRSRLGREVPLPPGFVRRLAGVCSEVTDQLETRAEAGRDWWPATVAWALEGQVPALPGVVVRPAGPDEVGAVLACCSDEGVPVTPMAGRSGVCGGSVPIFGGVALDLTALSGIRDIDDHGLTVDVAAGTWGDRFEEHLRQAAGLTLGHWPQSMALSTVGGWLACRSAGQYSTRYGKIEDVVTGLDVTLADGTTLRTGGAPRSATGPDLTRLFVGSEGTLGVITGARLRVRPVPAGEWRGAFGWISMAEGLDACRRILRRGATPAVLRLYDRAESARHFDVGDRCVLVVLDEADPVLVEATSRIVVQECTGAERLDALLVGRWQEHRNEVADLGRLAAAGIVADTIEVAARWPVLPGLYDRVVAGLSALKGTIAASGHESHAYGDGACLYFTFAGRPDAVGRPAAPTDASSAADHGEPAGARPADPTAAHHSDSAEGNVEAGHYYDAACAVVLAATMDAGGTISHHHGIGISRGGWLRSELGAGHAVLGRIKGALDPRGILNPGKLGLDSGFGAAPWRPAVPPVDGYGAQPHQRY